MNNQIQGGRGALEKLEWRTVPLRPSNPDPVSDKNHSFYYFGYKKKADFMILLPFVLHRESGNF